MTKSKKPARLANDSSRHPKVGYRRPPISSRWKPGQSGNPKGGHKKKGTKTVSTILRETLTRKVTIEEDGRRVTSTLQEVILRQLGNSAARGDLNAIKTLFALTDRYADSAEIELNPANLHPDDRAIIADYMARIQAAASTPDQRPADTPPAAPEMPPGVNSSNGNDP